MSASDKKKLRKEAEAQLLTEKQKKQLAEAKKLKRITFSFVAVMLVIALVAGTVLGIRGYKKAGFIDRMTTAAVANGQELNSVMVNYYFVDYIRNTYSEIKNSFGDSATMYLGYMGIDANAPLNTQPVSEGSTKTWADYYLEASLSKAKNDLALCAKANAAGFKLSEEDEKAIESNEQMLQYYAAIYGYKSVNKYLKALYGNGANLKSYNEYVRLTTLASAYYNDYSDKLTYTDEQISAYEKDKFFEYSSYSYALYTIKVSDYLTGGTTNADGSKTYTEEEKEAARAKAAADMEILKAITGLDAFDAAISDLAINKPSTEDTTDKSTGETTDETTGESTDKTTEETTDESTDKTTDETTDETTGETTDESTGETTDETTEEKKESVVSEKKDVVKYADLPENYVEWMTGERANGDITVFTKETTTKDANGNDKVVVESYEVVCFMERNDNNQYLANVRHLLVKFEGGTTDASGKVTYTDAQKATAKAEAERLLQVWKDGPATEESFIALLKEHSDDKDQSGVVNNEGLYEDIHPDSNYVDSFLAWSTDTARKAGDTGVILTEYGYHVMYFVGYNEEVTYREYMITEDMRAEDLDKWYGTIVDPVTYSIVNTKRIKMDFVMASLG